MVKPLKGLARWAAVAALAAVAVTGCAKNTGAKPVVPRGDPQTVFAERARLVAASWPAADQSAWNSGFVPIGDLTIGPSHGFPNVATRQAAGNGWYKLDATLPAIGSDGVVVFPDHSKLKVPVVGAAEAYRSLAIGGEPTCGTIDDDCGYLTVTGAKLTTATLRTSRGAATVPAWSFAVREMKNPMVRVAVAHQAVTRLVHADLAKAQYADQLAGAHYLTTTDRDRIDYQLGIGACDTDIQPRFWESDTVVVIGGTVTPPSGCTAQMLIRPVSVTLTRPVGDRVILDVVTGGPVLPIHP
jgi:hypothetical protein